LIWFYPWIEKQVRKSGTQTRQTKQAQETRKSKKLEKLKTPEKQDGRDGVIQPSQQRPLGLRFRKKR
jgi:hypothetical protein